MSEHNTTEGVEDDWRYMLFDIYADRARDPNDGITLEQAMVEYMIEVTWIDHELPNQTQRDGTNTLQSD